MIFIYPCEGRSDSEDDDSFLKARQLAFSIEL